MDEKSPSFYKTNSSQRSLVGSSLHRKHNIPSLDALLLRDAQLLCFRSDGKLRSADLFPDMACPGLEQLRAITVNPNMNFDPVRPLQALLLSHLLDPSRTLAGKAFSHQLIVKLTVDIHRASPKGAFLQVNGDFLVHN